MGELSPHSEDTLIEHLKFRRRVISATTCGISSKDERRAIENGKVEFRSGAKFPPPLAELLGAGAWHETAHLRCDIGPPADWPEPAAGSAMSVVPRKRPSATKMRSVAMGHKRTHALQNERRQANKKTASRRLVVCSK